MILAWALSLSLKVGAAEVPRTLELSQVSIAAPTGEVMFARAAAQGVALPQIAQAIQAAPDLPAAKTALERLKLAAPGEIRQSSSFEDTLRSLWGEVSHHIKEGPVDPSWAVPALIVKNGDQSYYLHGFSHGFFYNLNRRDVRKLAAQVKASGAPLLIEQNVPQAYGLDYGREMVTSADDRYHSSLPAWTTRWLGRPAHWLYFRALSLIVAARGLKDYARVLRGVAELQASRHPGIEEARAVELPLPLKSSLERDVVKRSRDMARYAREQAGNDVHLLVGWAHVFDLSWLLSQGPKS